MRVLWPIYLDLLLMAPLAISAYITYYICVCVCARRLYGPRMRRRRCPQISYLIVCSFANCHLLAWISRPSIVNYHFFNFILRRINEIIILLSRVIWHKDESANDGISLELLFCHEPFREMNSALRGESFSLNVIYQDLMRSIQLQMFICGIVMSFCS